MAGERALERQLSVLQMQFSETERTNNLEIETLRTNYADELETLRTQFTDGKAETNNCTKWKRQKIQKLKL